MLRNILSLTVAGVLTYFIVRWLTQPRKACNCKM